MASLYRFLILAVTLAASFPLAGCVVVGASSNGGWFIWPGGMGLFVIILLAAFFLRRRR